MPKKLRIKQGFLIFIITPYTIFMMWIILYLMLFFLFILNIYLITYYIKFSRSEELYIVMLTGNTSYFLLIIFLIISFLSLLLCISGFVLFYKCYKNLNKCTLNPKLFAHMICAVCLLIIHVFLGTISLGISKIIKLNIPEAIQQAMLSYAHDIEMKRNVDGLQVKLKCCGNHNYNDWFMIPWIKTYIGGLKYNK